MTGQPDAKLDPEARQNLYKAMQSLNPEFEGYSLDDFMRAITSLAAWNKSGKPAANFESSNKMLAKSNLPELTEDQMKAFNKLWADPQTSSFGGLDAETVK